MKTILSVTVAAVLFGASAIGSSEALDSWCGSQGHLFARGKCLSSRFKRCQGSDATQYGRPETSWTVQLEGTNSSPTEFTIDDLLKLINSFQNGEDVRINLRVENDTFAILREQVSPIDKSTATKMLDSSKDKGFPMLRLTDQAEIFEYPIDHDIQVELSVKGKDESWTKREWVSIGRLNLTDWDKFIKRAIETGLLGIDEYEYHGVAYGRLIFRQNGPSSFQSGGRSLDLSNNFYSLMKVSSQYKPVSGTEGFVVIVHEPHEAILGQFQMIQGLNALLNKNPSNGFVFLVEGEFEKSSRTVDFNGLDTTLDSYRVSGGIEPMLYRLLENYVIDGPLAYRLLFDRKIPAIAIDDLSYLSATPYGERPEIPRKELEVLSRIAKSVARLKLDEKDKTGQEALDQFHLILAMSGAYSKATTENFHGHLIVEYCEKHAERLKAIAEIVGIMNKEVPELKLREEIEFLERQSKAFSAEARTYRDALDRDSTMARLIVKQAGKTSDRIPIAFIGSFHTDGITKRLREAKVGYIVVEPRFSQSTSPADRARFDSMLYPSLRAAALKKLEGSRKLRVTPPPDEVKGPISSYLGKESERARAREQITRKSIMDQAPKDFEFDPVAKALRQNGSLANAQTELAGGGEGSPPPPRFRDAFAVFEPGEEGKNSRFFLMNVADSGWGEKSRLNFLRDHVMIPPPEVPDLAWRARVRYYQEPDTNRLYASFYDSTNKRFYLFEGEKAIELGIQIDLPKSSKDIRLQLAEILKLIRREKNG